MGLRFVFRLMSCIQRFRFITPGSDVIQWACDVRKLSTYRVISSEPT